MLPKYRWVDEASWLSQGKETSRYVYSTASSNVFSLYQYSGDSVAVPLALIDSISHNQFGDKEYYFKQQYNYTMGLDSAVTLDPLRLIDDSGKDLNIDSLVTAKSFLPYFSDYTFDGVFPGMTRQKWLDMIYQ